MCSSDNTFSFSSQGGYSDWCPSYSSEPTCERALGYNSSQCSSTGRLLWLPWRSSWICAWPVWWQCLREHVWVGKEIPTEQNRGKETFFVFRLYVSREITQFRVFLIFIQWSQHVIDEGGRKVSSGDGPKLATYCSSAFSVFSSVTLPCVPHVHPCGILLSFSIEGGNHTLPRETIE